MIALSVDSTFKPALFGKNSVQNSSPPGQPSTMPSSGQPCASPPSVPPTTVAPTPPHAP